MWFPAGNQTGVNAEVQGMAEAVIVAGARTPIGKLAGALAGFSAMDLGGFAIAEALLRAGVSPDQVDYVLDLLQVPVPVDQVAEIVGERIDPKPGESAERYLFRLSADETGLYFHRRREVGRVLDRKLKAIQEGRAELAQERRQLSQRARKPFLVEALSQVVVDDTRAHDGAVEEAERLAVAQDLLQRLRHRREVQRGSRNCCIVENVLLGQDRFARTGRADYEVRPIQREPSTEHRIEAGRTAREPLRHWAQTGWRT